MEPIDQMDEREGLEVLSRIDRVEAPPYLFTRISARIEDLTGGKVSPRQLWALGLSFLLLVGINVAVLLNRTPTKEQNSALLESFHLETHNQLYHD